MEYVSKTGGVLVSLFLLIAGYFIVTQGLFGESFIALILGLPWVLIFSYFEFFSPQSELVLRGLILVPILINAALLYGVGVLIDWYIDFRERKLSTNS